MTEREELEKAMPALDGQRTLPGDAVVEAQSREGIGLAGRVWLDNVGQPHRKLMVIQRVNGPPDTTPSQLLADGKQDEG